MAYHGVNTTLLCVTYSTPPLPQVIFFIVVAVVGTMVMIGWTLGVIESICITIVVGLSVDYTIHLCHIFASSTGMHTTRSNRKKHQ
jgi:predicted RND superfamily exporter protein